MRVLRALLWKEWRQYNRAYLLAFIIISLEPVMVPLTYWIYRTSVSADAWSFNIKSMLGPGYSNTEVIAMIAAVLLASLMLAGERDGGLDFLVSTPVSRRQIIKAKFIMGSLVLIAIMLIISLFLLGAGAVFPSQYSAQEVIGWAAITTAALLCLFSLALMVASFSRGTLSSALFTAIVMGLPWMLTSLALQVWREIGNISGAVDFKSRCLVTYSFIPDYIGREGRRIWDSSGNLILDRVTPDYPLEITLLLLATLLFLSMAGWLFERNPLERKGELLLFGNFKQIGFLFFAFLGAMVWAQEAASSSLSFVFYLLVMWLGIYLAILAAVGIIRWLRQAQG